MTRKKSKFKLKFDKGFKIFLEILLFVFVLLLIYNIVISILIESPVKIVPDEIMNAYSEKGIVGFDKVTPTIIGIGIILACLIITFLVIKNKIRFLRKFKKVIPFYSERVKKIKVKPTIKEGVIAMFVFLFWYIFNDAVNNHSGSPLGIYEIGIFFGDLGVKVLDFLWIGFFGSFFLVLILVARNQWKRAGTTSEYDSFMGLFVITAYMFMLIATVAQLSGVSSTANLDWFGGIGKATIYHIGVIMLIISLLYYVITE